MNTGRQIRTICLLMTLVLLSACGDSDPILIGFSGQLTGKTSEIGVYGRNGATLAIEIINASGGIDGRPLRLLAEDDLNTPQGALAADKRLLKAGVVAIIGHMTSSQSMAVIPLMQRTGIVYISPTTSTPLLTGKTDSFFRVMVQNTVHAIELAEYTKSALDLKTVVTIADLDNKSYSTTFIDTFTNNFISIGGKVLKKITYSSRHNYGWNDVLKALRDLKPQAVLLACPSQDAASLAQKIRAANLPIKLLSGAWAYTDKLLQWGGSSVEGMIFAINYTADNPSPAFATFRESYKNRFGTNPNFTATFGYEAVLALAQGLKKTHGSANGLAKAMAPSGLIQGVTNDFELDEYGDVKRSVFIVTIKDAEFRTIEMR